MYEPEFNNSTYILWLAPFVVLFLALFIFIFRKKYVMFPFYLLTFFAALPILAYILAQKTNNKGLLLVLLLNFKSLCLVVFVSKFAILGSLQKQILNNKDF